jgi:hypothetical protein
VTVSQLFALYRAGYEEAWRTSDGGVLRPFEVSVNGAGLADLERLILELALHDATNGTPQRSLAAFRRALAQGADVLGKLGLRLEDDASGAAGALVPALEEAA